jgi:hypothetical protein
VKNEKIIICWWGNYFVIIIVALAIGVSKLGPIIKNGVNTYGPKLTKTDVSLLEKKPQQPPGKKF